MIALCIRAALLEQHHAMSDIMNAADEHLPFKIGELPDELLLYILGCLVPIRGFIPSPAPEEERQQENATKVKTLHALSLACRRLHAISTPILYQSIIQPPTDWHLIPRLWSTLLQRPQLMKHVQYIETRMLDSQLDEPKDVYSDIEWAVLQQAFEDAPWATRIHHHTFFTADSRVQKGIIALIALAENLLDLAMVELETYVLPLADQPGLHPRLRRVWLRGPWHRYDADFMIAAEPVEGFNHAVEWIKAIEMRQRPWWDDDDDWRRNAVDIDEFTLDNCNMSPDEIQSHLRPCNSLRIFSCQWRNRWTHSDAENGEAPPIDLPQLRQDLLRFRGDLESLTLDTLESGWRVSMEENIPAIGSLRDFPVLKHLDVSGLVLWGDGEDTAQFPPLTPLLPPSLETLVINVEWDDDVEEGLHGLARDCKAMVSNLKSVECMWRPAPKDVADVLIKDFRDLGVELKLSVDIS